MRVPQPKTTHLIPQFCLIEKKLDTGKRSGAWVKYKVNKAQEFVIGGYTPDNPLDALIVGYYEGDKLIFVSKVRNGFVPRLRREVWSKLKGLETNMPFLQSPGEKTHTVGSNQRRNEELRLAKAGNGRTI